MSKVWVRIFFYQQLISLSPIIIGMETLETNALAFVSSVSYSAVAAMNITCLCSPHILALKMLAPISSTGNGVR